MVGTDEPLRSFRLSVNHFTLSAFSRPRFTHRHPTRIAAGALCHALVCKAFSLWSGVSVLLRLTTPSSLRSFAPVPPFPTASSSPTIANIRCRTCQCSASLHIVTHDERITAQSASVGRWRWGCLRLHIPQRNETREPKRIRGRWGVFTDGG